MTIAMAFDDAEDRDRDSNRVRAYAEHGMLDGHLAAKQMTLDSSEQ